MGAHLNYQTMNTQPLSLVTHINLDAVVYPNFLRVLNIKEGYGLYNFADLLEAALEAPHKALLVTGESNQLTLLVNDGPYHYSLSVIEDQINSRGRGLIVISDNNEEIFPKIPGMITPKAYLGPKCIHITRTILNLYLKLSASSPQPMPEPPVYVAELRFINGQFIKPAFETIWYRVQPNPPDQSEYVDSSGQRVVLISADTPELLAKEIRRYTSLEVHLRSLAIPGHQGPDLQLCPDRVKPKVS